MPKKWTIQFIYFVLLLINYLGAVLNNNDITEIAQFGCQWTGGSHESGVTCTCQSNAEEFFIQESSIPSYDTIVMKINNCNSVRFGPNAISNMRNLRRIELSNINNIFFDNSGLSWNAYVQSNNDYYNNRHNMPTLKITIDNSNIKEISSYTFQGQISNIIIKNCTIAKLSPFAFSSLTHTELIQLSGVNFVVAEAQSFKKFKTDDLIISDSSFEVLPSRLFSDVIVLETFRIKNCSFGHIKSGAFMIKYPKTFEISNSEVNVLEGEAFKVMTRGSVKIRNNIFNVTHSGAFVGICLDKDTIATEEEILFDSNTFNYLQSQSLAVNSTSFVAKFSNILIYQTCDCKLSDDLAESKNEEEFYCTVENDIKVTLKDFKKFNCSVLKGYSTLIIVLGVMLALLIIIGTVLVFYFKRNCKQQSEYITDKNGKAISLIMPDGRTYRETELHVVVERADLLTTDL